MSNRMIKNYINYQKSIVNIKIIWQVFGFAFIFLIIDIMPCIIMKLNIEIMLLSLIVLMTFIFLVYVTINKNDYDKLIIGYAIVFTDVSLVFAVLSYAVLVSYADVSPMYLIMELILYFGGSVVNVITVKGMIRKDKYNVTKRATVTLWPGVVGGAIGVFLVKMFLGDLKYNLVVMITVIIFMVLCMFFSMGFHLYYCYYLMKKYDKEEI